MQYTGDDKRRVLDLDNVETPKPHRRHGYSLEVFAPLVAALPQDAVLPAVGDHSCGDLKWMKRITRPRARPVRCTPTSD